MQVLMRGSTNNVFGNLGKNSSPFCPEIKENGEGFTYIFQKKYKDLLNMLRVSRS